MKTNIFLSIACAFALVSSAHAMEETHNMQVDAQHKVRNNALFQGAKMFALSTAYSALGALIFHNMFYSSKKSVLNKHVPIAARSKFTASTTPAVAGAGVAISASTALGAISGMQNEQAKQKKRNEPKQKDKKVKKVKPLSSQAQQIAENTLLGGLAGGAAGLGIARMFKPNLSDNKAVGQWGAAGMFLGTAIGFGYKFWQLTELQKRKNALKKDKEPTRDSSGEAASASAPSPAPLACNMTLERTKSLPGNGQIQFPQ